MAYKNTEDRRAYHKRWYEANKEKRRPYLNEKTKKRAEDNKKFVNEYALKKGCCICGYNKCARALDFHHVDPTTKVDNVSSLNRYGLESVKKEMEKCVVICANCHRELHDGIITLE